MASPAGTRPYAALRHSEFRWLAISMLVSLLGSQMQNVAIDWHVWILTKSPLALGLLGLTRVGPIVVLSLWGGIVADRADRRRVMLVTQTLLTCVALALAVLTYLGRERAALIYLLTAFGAGAAAFDNPARQSLVPRLVPVADLPGALAVMLTAFQLAAIGGPALAGVLIASGPALAGIPAPAHTRGLAIIYLLNAVSFLGVLATLVKMKTSGGARPASEPAEPPLASLKAGLRFVFRTPIMVSTMTLDFFATFFSGSMSLLPIFADRILKTGAVGYGWLRAAPGIGAVAASLFTAFRRLPRRQGKTFLWAVAAYGLATVVFGFSRNPVLTFLALAAVGLSDTISTVVRQIVRQLATPDPMRGRMTGVNMIFFMGGPQLGELEAGLVASVFASAALGATVAVVSGGVATIAITGLVAAAWPVVRSYDADSSLREAASRQSE